MYLMPLNYTLKMGEFDVYFNTMLKIKKLRSREMSFSYSHSTSVSTLIPSK